MPALISIYGSCIFPLEFLSGKIRSGSCPEAEGCSFDGLFLALNAPYHPLKETTSRNFRRLTNGILLSNAPLAQYVVSHDTNESLINSIGLSKAKLSRCMVYDRFTLGVNRLI